MIILLYNILFPIVFIFFLPGLIIKLIKRGGYKKTYLERFCFFDSEKLTLMKRVALKKPIWIHAVSVGETQLAVDFINYWKEKDPEQEFVISTTTTTGQELARKKIYDKATIIFNPIDFYWAIKKLLNLMKPKMLVIFETEIWPNMISVSANSGVKVIQVNARISDHSFKGYKKYRAFIDPFLRKVSLTCAQTDVDVQRLKEICPTLNVVKTGTMKFDQKIPGEILKINVDAVFEKNSNILLAASTHPGEEKFIAQIFKKLREKYKNLKLIIIPRHAERGNEIVNVLNELDILYSRRSEKTKNDSFVDCLLADTTGEMLSFMSVADIVIMGKSFAGNDGGHNIIEPAILGKPVICGEKLKNFRFVLNIMKSNHAVLSIPDEKLADSIADLLSAPDKCYNLGQNAKKTVEEQKGASHRTVECIEKLLEDN
jgi:3-deoxy-D-manno-octulosonic-acid transferase